MWMKDNLQDAYYEKEQAKIAHRQKMGAERLERLRNPRGAKIKSQSIMSQQTANDNAKDLEKQYDYMLKDQAIKVERALAQAEAEEEYVRRHASEQLVRSWEEAKVEKTEREKYEKMQKDFDPKFCGPSSCQKMPGMEYDDQLPLKIAEQKRQMKQWVKEQIEEKRARDVLTKEEEREYAEIMLRLDDLRLSAEIEEKELINYINKTVTESNKELAKANTLRKSSYESDMKDTQSSIVMDVSKESGVDETGRIRRDMFRGYTKEQQRLLLLENEEILMQKKMAEKDARDIDKAYMLEQTLQCRAMEYASYEEKLIKGALAKEGVEYILQQQAENKQKQKEDKEFQLRGANEGYFDKFGTSYR